MLITDDMVQAAFDWLEENAGPAAKAKAERVRAEYNSKRVRSMMYLDAKGTVAEREAAALISQEHQDAVRREVDAVEKDEWFRNQRSKCEAIIEGWRTESANQRGMARVA